MSPKVLGTFCTKNRYRAIVYTLDVAIQTLTDTREAILEAMRSTVPGLAEHELDAVAQFIFVRHGPQGEAYRAIVASGPAAMNPHHRAGDRIMNAGELVLMDYCPDLGYYRCDITRQWPVNGKFSSDQRDLYSFYLSVYEAVLFAIKGGKTSQQIFQEALPKIEAVRTAAKFSKPAYAEAADQFVEIFRRQAASGRGGLGHAVGMATHDFGNGSGLMRPGMVFTIEPELVVPSEQIYIRLEDVILITETGYENLSGFLPMEADAIEKLMAESGRFEDQPPARGTK